MNPVLTTNQKPSIDTQKQEKKEYKHTTKKKSPNHKGRN